MALADIPKTKIEALTNDVLLKGIEVLNGNLSLGLLTLHPVPLTLSSKPEEERMCKFVHKSYMPSKRLSPASVNSDRNPGVCGSGLLLRCLIPGTLALARPGAGLRAQGC